MNVQVGGEGPLNCRIAFVGEAPGETEVRMGRPFVGQAGGLLDTCMRTAGVNRNSCYLTNVVKERPPNNNISIFFSCERGKLFESPSFREYVDLLRTELQHCTANVIVAVGQTALYALTGIPDKITKRRGSVYESTLLPGRKVIACIHPSAALRQYMYRRLIIFDLQRAIEHSATPALPKDESTYILDPTFDEAIAYLKYIQQNTSRTACDIEVKNGEVSMISFAHKADEAICIPFIKGGDDNFSMEEELQIWDEIAKILEDPTITKIGQNLAFDTTFLHRKYGIASINIDDTMVAQGILMPEYPKGLDFITSLYSDLPYYKDEGKRWLKGISEDEMGFRLYNAKDSIVVMQTFDKIMSEVTRLGNAETYKRQVSLIPILSFMSERGIKIDVDGLNKLATETLAEIERLSVELNIACGHEINSNSPKQVAQYFYVEKGLPAYTKDGAVTTDDEALQRIARKGYKEAELILKLRGLRKAYGTYYTVTLEDGRLKCSFNPVGAADTGRLSSSETIFGTGTNLQNQPKEMKDKMIADDGYLMFEADLSQAENRIVAYIAPEPKMIAAFESKTDVHKSTASLIFGVPIEEITKEQRQQGKQSNHSLNYDMSADAFSRHWLMPLDEGRRIHTRYHQVYPGVHKYHEWIRAALGLDRKVTNLMGRTRLFLDRWGDSLFKSAYAFIPQSTVADVINERGLEFVYYSKDPLMQKVELLNQVHDSIVFQIPVSLGWDAIATILSAIKTSLETPLTWRGNSFVIPAEFKCGRRLGKATVIKIDSTINSQLENIWNSEV